MLGGGLWGGRIAIPRALSSCDYMVKKKSQLLSVCKGNENLMRLDFFFFSQRSQPFNSTPQQVPRGEAHRIGEMVQHRVHRWISRRMNKWRMQVEGEGKGWRDVGWDMREGRKERKDRGREENDSAKARDWGRDEQELG